MQLPTKKWVSSHTIDLDQFQWSTSSLIDVIMFHVEDKAKNSMFRCSSIGWPDTIRGSPVELAFSFMIGITHGTQFFKLCKCKIEFVWREEGRYPTCLWHQHCDPILGFPLYMGRAQMKELAPQSSWSTPLIAHQTCRLTHRPCPKHHALHGVHPFVNLNLHSQ